MRQDCDILSHQFCGQQGGGTSTHVAPWCDVCGRFTDQDATKRANRWYIYCIVGCTKIWRFPQNITEPSQKLGLSIRRKHANSLLVLTTPYALTVGTTI